jgi:pyoverdine/dityrosine biosynthesis protein Dit1
MKTDAGLWIDHRRALVVTLSGGGEKIQEILSGVESQPGRKDGVPMDVHYESMLVKVDDSHQWEYTHQLNQYYAKVITAVGHADALLIFGPGGAQFKARINDLQMRIPHAIDAPH